MVTPKVRHVDPVPAGRSLRFSPRTELEGVQNCTFVTPRSDSHGAAVQSSHVARRDLSGRFAVGPLDQVGAVTQRRIRPAAGSHVRDPATVTTIGNYQQAITTATGQGIEPLQRLLPPQSAGRRE